MNDDFQDFLAAPDSAGVRFLVVGAHAMAVHGVPRATGDLDVWIECDEADAERAWRALEAFGRRPPRWRSRARTSPPPGWSCSSACRRGGSTS